MGTLAFGLVLLAVSVGAGALTLVRNARLVRHGREVLGTVERVYPSGGNNYPPYGSWGPHLDVRYELDERRRRAVIWLSETEEADYHPGQKMALFVSRHWPRKVRTLREPNLAGRFVLPAEFAGVVIGLVYVVWGVVRIATG
jgi:hypothetical protein